MGTGKNFLRQSCRKGRTGVRGKIFLREDAKAGGRGENKNFLQQGCRKRQMGTKKKFFLREAAGKGDGNKENFFARGCQNRRTGRRKKIFCGKGAERGDRNKKIILQLSPGKDRQEQTKNHFAMRMPEQEDNDCSREPEQADGDKETIFAVCVGKGSRNKRKIIFAAEAVFWYDGGQKELVANGVCQGAGVSVFPAGMAGGEGDRPHRRGEHDPLHRAVPQGGARQPG